MAPVAISPSPLLASMGLARTLRLKVSFSPCHVSSTAASSSSPAYSYLIFVLLYIPCISVMGAIARESSRGWMTFSILWGLNIAYSLSTLYYQTVS